jgi:hypothetical protein
MMNRPSPTIRATVPVLGDGSVERSIIEKLAPIFNNVAREVNILSQRLARLEAIGPGVQIAYTPTSIAELKEAIEIIAPKYDFEDDWGKEKLNDIASQNTA